MSLYALPAMPRKQLSGGGAGERERSRCLAPAQHVGSARGKRNGSDEQRGWRRRTASIRCMHPPVSSRCPETPRGRGSLTRPRPPAEFARRTGRSRRFAKTCPAAQRARPCVRSPSEVQGPPAAAREESPRPVLPLLEVRCSPESCMRMDCGGVRVSPLPQKEASYVSDGPRGISVRRPPPA
jgi:hypothetical protein